MCHTRPAFTTLRLTAEEVKNLSALSGVAYTNLGVILLSLAAPNPAPKVCYWQKLQLRFHSRASAAIALFMVSSRGLRI